MFIEDPFHQRQTYACTFELFLTVQALKDLEELIGIPAVESRAVVANEIGDVPVSDRRADGDLRGGFFRGIFKCVSDEVYPDLFEQVFVPQANGQRIDIDAEAMHGPDRR